MEASGPDAAPETPAAVVPAERRARCAAHPRVGAVTTCRGCGLFLCTECALPAEDPRCTRCKADGHPIPWEDPGVGRAAAFFRTLKFMLTNSKGFWAAMPWSGGLKGPLVFGLIAALFGALGKAAYVFLSAWLIKSSFFANALDSLYRPLIGNTLEGKDLLRKLPGMLEQMGDVVANAQVSQLASTPLEAVVEMFVLAALTHPVARWLGGQGTFEGTFRVVAYANAAQFIKLFPGVGLPFAYLFGLIFMVGGLRRAHGLTGGRALFTALWWIPPAGLLFLLLVVWAVKIALTVIAGGG